MASDCNDSNGWDYVSSRAIKKPYLGVIQTRWRVITRTEEVTRITLYKEKFVSSLVCAILLSVLLVLLLVLVSRTKELYGEHFWVFTIPCIWLFLGLNFGYRRELVWKKNSDEISLVFGFYPFVRTVSLNKNTLSARLEWSKRRKRKIAIIYLYDNKDVHFCMKLIGATRRAWIIPVFGGLSEILEGRCTDETGADI